MIATGLVAGAAQVSWIRPSSGVAATPRTAAGAGGGVGAGVGATVNVQVASWSACATAAPALSGVSKATVGHSNVAPLVQAGMSRVMRSAWRPAVRGPRSFGSRPIPTGNNAKGVRDPNRRLRAGWTALAGTPLTSCLPSVNRIIAGRFESGGMCVAARSIAAT